MMDLPPPNSTTRATTIGPQPRVPVVCTIVCDETTVTLTYQRGEHPPHLVETYDRGDGFHLGPVLERLILMAC